MARIIDIVTTGGFRIALDDGRVVEAAPTFDPITQSWSFPGVPNDVQTLLGQVTGTEDYQDIIQGATPTTPALSAEVFSLSEVDTRNKWIDGKTIFRKVFTVPAMGNNVQDFQAFGFTVESWIRTGGFVNDGPNVLMLPVPVPNFNDSVVGVAIINSGTTLQIHAGSAAAHDGGFVWLEYTKA